jgi:hypothetical protein
VRVSVAGDGNYVVSDIGPSGQRALARGDLGADIDSNYPLGTLEFGAAGWPRLPGAAAPRAGHFTIGSSTATRVVIVQLGGCVRCT